MYQTISKTADELEQWRETSSTEDTLTSLTQIETSLDKIRGMDTAILQEEEEVATEFPSLLKLLTKKTIIFGNNAHIREWWYEVITESHGRARESSHKQMPICTETEREETQDTEGNQGQRNQ